VKLAIKNTVPMNGKEVLWHPAGGARQSRGVTLLELMVVIAIVGILVLVSGFNLYETASKNDVLNCAKRMAADIKEARRWAQGGGSRVIFLTAASSTVDRGAVDLDLSWEISPAGALLFQDEFYIVFSDSADIGSYSAAAYLSGVLRHGTKGDQLCEENIVILKESTLLSGVPSSTPRSQLQFSAHGTLLNFGSGNKNLYLEKNGQVARIEVVGLTGFTRVYVNKDGYYNCDGGDCSVGTWTDGVNNQWQPIQHTL